MYGDPGTQEHRELGTPNDCRSVLHPFGSSQKVALSVMRMGLIVKKGNAWNMVETASPRSTAGFQRWSESSPIDDAVTKRRTLNDVQQQDSSHISYICWRLSIVVAA
jgi:hypothetical protein